MNEKKIKYTEIIGLGSVYVILTTIIYILGYSNIVRFDIVKYFRIQDYLNFSVKAFLPITIGFLPGYIFGYFSSFKSKREVNKFTKAIIVILFLSSFLVALLPIMTSISTIDARFIRVLFLVSSLILLIRNSDFDAEGIEYKLLIKSTILILIISFGLGAYSAQKFIKFASKEDESIVETQSNEIIKGNTMFLLSDFIIIYEEDDHIIVIPVNEVKKIVE